jgi:branched-chain amino acid transport system permease protein
MTLLLQLILNGLISGLVLAVMACAFGLVYRSLRVFHLAFAGLLLVGPYAAQAAQQVLGLGVLPAVMAGTACAALATLAVELLVYGPFARRRASLGATMIASLAVAALLQNLLVLGFGNQILTLDRAPAIRIEIGPVAVSNLQCMQAAVAASILLALAIGFRRFLAFKVWWAMGDEPGLIPLLGLPERRYRSMLMLYSGALGGLAACLLAVEVGIDPNAGTSQMLAAAVAVLFGGIDRLRGWIAGALVVALLQSLLIWTLSPRWVDLVTFSVLIATLALRPSGLVQRARRIEET